MYTERVYNNTQQHFCLAITDTMHKQNSFKHEKHFEASIT